MADEVEEKEEVEVEEKEEKRGDGITLTKQEYADLMSRISKAEARIEERGRREEQEEEDEPEEKIEPDKFTKMTPAQFFDTILSEVQKKVSQPVMLAVATLQTRMEIQEASAKYKEDFWDYEADIKRIASANPTMSIEDAYLLAKSKKDPSSKDKEPKKETEKKEPPKPPHGEKPGLNKETLKQTPKTVREAAEMALNSLNLETKEEGK